MVNTNNITCSLMAVRMVLLELRLYMDTHGCENQAMCMFREYKEKYKKLLAEYEKVKGPINGMTDEECLWATTPFPWVNSGSDC